MNHVAEIARSSERIAQLLVSENYAKKVPSCPEWTLLDLATHIGEVQQFWSHDIRAGAATSPWQGELTGPDSHIDAADWLRHQTQSLIDAISCTPATAPCWTWWGEPQIASAVARHQVQEAEIHRWDAELAVAEPSPIPLEIAVDGVPEFLHVHRFAIQELELPHIHLAASDTTGEWHINETATDTTGIIGTASNLVLFLTGRYPIEKLEVSGNSSALHSFIKALPEINR